jgi:hypothetical protein
VTGRALLCCLLVSLPLLRAQDASALAALRKTVLDMREHAEENRETRGATPQLTTAKHQLRDWIETYVARFPRTGTPQKLWDDLHAALRETTLFCDDDTMCYPSNLGYLDEVQVSKPVDGFLALMTAVGIWCGYDYSAYVYEWRDQRWQRIFENEQTTYTEKDYIPQLLHSVHVSGPGSEGSRLIMTLGSRPGCASAYHPVYYRVWRVDSQRRVSAKPILDGSESAFIDGDPPVKGKLEPNDILIGFVAGGTGYGLNHRALRHFEVSGEQVRQTDPIAASPRDFVSEWLNLPWPQSGPHSESAELKTWWDKLHREDGQGDTPDPALRCSTGEGLWQIATQFHEQPKMFYLVRWREPYRFTMAGVSENAYPDCTLEDPRGARRPNLFE